MNSATRSMTGLGLVKLNAFAPQALCKWPCAISGQDASRGQTYTRLGGSLALPEVRMPVSHRLRSAVGRPQTRERTIAVLTCLCASSELHELAETGRAAAFLLCARRDEHLDLPLLRGRLAYGFRSSRATAHGVCLLQRFSRIRNREYLFDDWLAA